MTTTHLFANRATAKIAVDLASNDTAITLVPGGGALFPQPGANEYFRLVLQKGTAATDQREYMRCTNVTGDTLTVQRGLEGTPAANFTVGDDLSLVATALTFGGLVQKVGVTLQGALEVEADPTTPLGIATKAFVENGRLADAPSDGKDYARQNAAWHALGAAAGLAVPIPISAGGTGGTTLPAAQTNLVIGVTTIDDLEPTTKKFGDRWIKPSNMTELVYVPNAGGGSGVWINPMDAQSEAYPIAIAKGGTGAITAPAALTNLGGTTVGTGVFTAPTAAAARTVLGIDGSAPFVLADGTAAAPGLAWANEPGLGWLRPQASVIAMAAGGLRLVEFGFNNPGTFISVYPKLAGNLSQIAITNQPAGAAAYNYLGMRQNADGTAAIFTGHNTTAASRGNLILDAPFTVSYNDIRIGGAEAAHAGRLFFSNASGAQVGEIGNSVLTGFGDSIGINVPNATGSLSLGINGAEKLRFQPNGTFTAVTFTALPLQLNANGGGSADNFIINQLQSGSNYATMSFLHPAGGKHVRVGASNLLEFVNWANTAVIASMNDIGQLSAKTFAMIDNFNYNMSIAGQYYNFNHATGYAFRWNSVGGVYEWVQNGQITFTFDTTGQAYKLGGGTAWGNVSDERLKENIEDYKSGLAEILKLRPRIFNWRKGVKRDTSKREVSLVAQEAEVVMPDIVHTASGIGEYKLDDLRVLDVSNITYALINAVKTLNARLAAVEALQ